MRLLHVIPTYLPAVRYGGPIQTVHALCRALAGHGHDVHVYTTSVDGPHDSDVPLGQPVDLDGVKVTYFRSAVLRRLYWSPPLGRALEAGVPGFDLVHVHAIYLWPTWMAARAARRHGVPYVLSPRGMLVPELIRRKNRLIKTAWINLIERRNAECAVAVHTTSEVEARHLESFGWKLPKVVTIPHGVDDPPGTMEGSRLTLDVAGVISRSEPYVLGLGRISWEKGFNRLIEAMPRAPGVRVVIAGGDAGQAASLAGQARALGVAERTTIIARHVDGPDKEALFAHARAFAMTSLSENFGLAAFEAMRRGLPVLAVPDVGMSEIVRDADAGLVVAADPDSIGGALKRLIDDKAAARAMGERGRACVVARYGWPAVASRMEEVYRAAVGNRGPRS